MRTAVGVFSDHNQAEEAIRKLLERHVPPERISFLTRSEPAASSLGKHLESPVPSAPDAAPARSVISVAGVGPVFVQGHEAKAIVEPSTLSGGSITPLANDPWRKPSTGTGAEEDASFFRRVLSDGCSVIIVRSDSHLVAAAACEVLDKLSLGIRKSVSARSGVVVREVPGAVIAAFSGKIAHDEGCLLLRETVRAFLNGRQKRILLNLEQVDFVDSAGLGELVRAHTAVHSRGGRLTLVSPAAGVLRILRVTQVDKVFDIAPDQFTALSQTYGSAE